MICWDCLRDASALHLWAGHPPPSCLFPSSLSPPALPQLRGALRGAAAPVNLSTLARDLGLEGLGSLASLLPSLIDELVDSGAIAGRLAAGGTSWTPAVYVRSQQEAVRTFFQQNGFITYDMVGALNNGLQLMPSFIFCHTHVC